MSDLLEHLKGGATTVARAWALRRADGVEMGFTDHDRDLAFDGIVFRAGTGLSAQALAQTTGLSVDNTEALGMLSDAAITPQDIRAGRYDGAEVRAWLVNWADPSQRRLQFRGTLGEIARDGAGFRAELRGLAELLNQPQGRTFHRRCSAVLGDGQCRVELGLPGYSETRPVEAIDGGRVLRFADFAGFDDRWFEKGRLVVLAGAAEGLVGVVKNDRFDGQGRRIELWDAIAGDLRSGDLVRLEAGCDKRAETCRLKFGNFLNFRGFPHLPSESWLVAVPRSGDLNDGRARE